VLTRYEILRGLRAKSAVRQELAFDALCRLSQMLPLTEPIAVRAAAIYADLQLRGELIGDADIPHRGHGVGARVSHRQWQYRSL
jgi:tRNA(fMet)-specific endonuclease VapC